MTYTPEMFISLSLILLVPLLDLHLVYLIMIILEKRKKVLSKKYCFLERR